MQSNLFEFPRIYNKLFVNLLHLFPLAFFILG